jgi:hypothetical protein
LIKTRVLITVIRVNSALEYSVITVMKVYPNSYIQPDGCLIISRNVAHVAKLTHLNI